MASYLVCEIGAFRVAIEARQIARVLGRSDLGELENARVASLAEHWGVPREAEGYLLELAGEAGRFLELGAQSQYRQVSGVCEPVSGFLEGMQGLGVRALMLQESEILLVLDAEASFEQVWAEALLRAAEG